MCVFMCMCLLSGMQSASFLRRIIFSSVACLPLPHFFALSHKRHHFHKKKIVDIKCVLVFYIYIYTSFYEEFSEVMS
jgi:hypothetical protein